MMKQLLRKRTSLASVVLVVMGVLSVGLARAQQMNYPVTGSATLNPLAPGLASQLQTPPPAVSRADTNLGKISSTSLVSTTDTATNVVTADYNASLFDKIPDVKLTSFKVGSITVKPYGILWSNMKYMSSRTAPESGQFILWVDSEEVQGENAFVIDARPSRIGVDLSGPTYDMFGGLAGGGKVEVDFLGTFSTENQPSVRLRHVYWEAKNKDLRILTGQTWDVVSPLLPHTVNFSVNWGVGNIGFRRAQFRLERYFHLSDSTTWTVQGAGRECSSGFPVGGGSCWDHSRDRQLADDPGTYGTYV